MSHARGSPLLFQDQVFDKSDAFCDVYVVKYNNSALKKYVLINLNNG